MTNDFLPEGTKIPDSREGYMKFAEGDNRFRVLSSAITGIEFWVEVDGGKKPFRIKEGGVAPDSFVDEPKYFWAFVVWNYASEKVQILEVTQKGVMKSIKALVGDEDWGDPKQYDIVVTRVGQMKESKYNVVPKPAKKLDPGITQLYEDMEINLNALYEGKDPFKKEDLAETVAKNFK